MKQHSTLSLLIPAYNAATFLPRLLSSAHAQTAPFDEIWVFDDCSLDDTERVARNFGATVVSAETNRGCSAAKNVLARRVQTDWLHFHDADDELLPNFVALARRWIEDDCHDVILFNYEVRDEATGNKCLRTFDASDLSRDPRSFAIREQINPFCGLYRRSAFLRAGGYDEDPSVLYNEDVAFHIKIAFAGLSFAVEEEVAIINHRRTGSMSSANELKCIQAHFRVLEKVATTMARGSYGPELASKLWHCAGMLAAGGDWAKADQAADMAATLAPMPRSAGSILFRSLAKLSPRVALRTRERFIRQMKPHLRHAR